MRLERFFNRIGSIRFDNPRPVHYYTSGEYPLGNLVRLSDTPIGYYLPPPTLGQHIGEILTELGYDATKFASLREHSVV